ncbi:MAG: ABC transporter ATP-binding protein [Dehalococcoidia bacterium]|nr:ABC transporter ATP-binding protein [Dehalococcoidia bacterium]
MTGDRQSAPATAASDVRPSGEPRLAVEHVAKTYVTYGLWPFVRRVPVLSDASLEVGAGETVALVGGNGSGKSTLMMIIAGTLSRNAGTVRLDGRIGYCPQYPVLYEKLTVAETFRLFGVAYRLDRSAVADRKAELMETLAFGQYDDFRVEHLSGGTRQKLNLALALLHDPEVLLLDEPYAGFDYETYLRFWEMSSDIAARGRSILIVSHFVEDRERFDRIYRVADGRCERER